MNTLDAIIGYFNPTAGARRVKNRRNMELFEQQRSYEAASRARRARNWSSTSTSADAEISGALSLLRDRSRELRRNTTIGASIINKHADYIVGTGIRPRFKTGKPTLDKALQEAHDRWAEKAHINGEMTYYGIQYLACQEMVEGGEAFAVKRYAPKKDLKPRKAGRKVLVDIPLRIDLLESDHVDESIDKVNGSNTITSGIEVDKNGARVKYHMFKGHPGSGQLKDTSIQTMPAENVAHLYDPQRAQLRGVPWLTPCMVEIKDLHEYKQAENVRKKIEACNVAVVTSGDDPNEDPLGADEGDGELVDADGNLIERFEPGMIAYSRGGRQIHFNTPAATVGVEQYLRTCKMSISSGARIPYELATGDYGHANFASGKMGILGYKKFVTNFQKHTFIPRFCRPIDEWFIQDAMFQGIIPDNVDVRIVYDLPEFETINRLEDAKADLAEVRLGKRSPQQIIGQTGRDPVSVLDEFDEWNAMIDKRSLVFDSDPRKMSANGQSHDALNAGEPDENPPKKTEGKGDD
jgi:lambda family phage portal protein